MIKVKWRLELDPDLKYPFKFETVKTQVSQILRDPRSWRRFGIDYRYSGKHSDIIIRFSSRKSIHKTCQLSDELSCAIVGENYTMINEDNWWNGVPKSGLSLSDYRKYVILHEVGHLAPMYLEHPKSLGSREKCHVMTQQTLGKCNATKYKPNPWPISSPTRRHA